MEAGFVILYMFELLKAQGTNEVKVKNYWNRFEELDETDFV